MTYEELVAYVNRMDDSCIVVHIAADALRAVINLHKEVTWDYGHCRYCQVTYPCETIMELIEGLRKNDQTA